MELSLNKMKLFWIALPAIILMACSQSRQCISEREHGAPTIVFSYCDSLFHIVVSQHIDNSSIQFSMSLERIGDQALFISDNIGQRWKDSQFTLVIGTISSALDTPVELRQIEKGSTYTYNITIDSAMLRQIYTSVSTDETSKMPFLLPLAISVVYLPERNIQHARVESREHFPPMISIWSRSLVVNLQEYNINAGLGFPFSNDWP